MKSLYRYVALVVVAGFLAASQTAFAGECCKKAAADTKAGKACEKCLTEQCCKDASAKVTKAGKGKVCEKCAAKAKEEKKS